jgi:hypothetical protein
MAFTGNLKTVAFPDILQLLSTGKKTGVLTITKGEVQKDISFRDGNIIYASSRNSEEDFLGTLLLKRGRISKADLERALMLQKTSGKKLGMILVDMELFSREEIVDCLKLQVEEIAYNLFSWDSGDFIFQEGQLPEIKDLLVNLSSMSVIMEGTRRIDEWLEIRKVLPKEGEILRPAMNPRLKSDEITLSLEEFQVLSVINGERTLAEILSVSPVGEFATYRGIYNLKSAGLIEIAGAKSVGSVEDPDEEENLWWLILRLYSACFDAIRRNLQRKLGSDNARVNEMLATYKKGVWAHFTSLRSSDPRENLAGFKRTMHKIPREARVHRILNGLNCILAEQLSLVRSLLGVNVLRSVESEIKKDVSLPIAEKRKISTKYDLEADLFRVLRESKREVVF